MPLYEYVCRKCGKRHDIRHGFEETAGPCPSCGGILERIFHVAGIHFKGSGFYTTDYKRSSAASSTGSSTGSSSSDSSTGKSDSSVKSDSGSPAKPAEKSA